MATINGETGAAATIERLKSINKELDAVVNQLSEKLGPIMLFSNEDPISESCSSVDSSRQFPPLFESLNKEMELIDLRICVLKDVVRRIDM